MGMLESRKLSSWPNGLTPGLLLTRLVLVLPLDLKDVEEVGCCGVDFDQVVTLAGHWVWEIRYPEFLRALRGG